MTTRSNDPKTGGDRERDGEGEGGGNGKGEGKREAETELPSGWLRGVLDPCLLGLLRDGEAYGYELAGRLEQAGLGRIPGGSLYPALLRLEKQGRIRAEWRAGDGGPGRKYYALTAEGTAAVGQLAQTWERFAASVSGVLVSEVGS